MKMKDENGRDIKLGLEEARRIMATDYCVGKIIQMNITCLESRFFMMFVMAKIVVLL